MASSKSRVVVMRNEKLETDVEAKNNADEDEAGTVWKIARYG